MVTITAGEFVCADRNFGVCITNPNDRRENWYSPFLLCHVERLVAIDGWHEILTIVCRHIDAPADEVRTNIDRALWAMDLEIVRNCWGGGMPPLSGMDEITIEGLEAILREIEINKATRVAKRQHMKMRRSQFQAVRSDRVLALLDSGVPYVCVHPGCGITAKLTLDHRIALSRGGTDDLENLQFMCGPHNSQKRDST